MNERPEHLPFGKEITALLGIDGGTTQVTVPTPEAVLRIHTLGESQMCALLPLLYDTYLDIIALSNYLSQLVSSGELRTAHHFLMLLYAVCRLSAPRALVEAAQSNALLQGYVTGALCGFRLEEQMLNERYTAHVEDPYV